VDLNVFLFGARGERFVVNCDFSFEVLTARTVARLLGYARLTLRPQRLIRCLSHPTYFRSSRSGHFLHRFSLIDLRCGVALVTTLGVVGVILGLNYILDAIDVVLKGLNTHRRVIKRKPGTYLKNLSVDSNIQGRESFLILAE